jgi:hypothetical protein
LYLLAYVTFYGYDNEGTKDKEARARIYIDGRKKLGNSVHG